MAAVADSNRQKKRKRGEPAAVWLLQKTVLYTTAERQIALKPASIDHLPACILHIPHHEKLNKTKINLWQQQRHLKSIAGKCTLEDGRTSGLYNHLLFQYKNKTERLRSFLYISASCVLICTHIYGNCYTYCSFRTKRHQYLTWEDVTKSSERRGCAALIWAGDDRSKLWFWWQEEMRTPGSSSLLLQHPTCSLHSHFPSTVRASGEAVSITVEKREVTEDKRGRQTHKLHTTCDVAQRLFVCVFDSQPVSRFRLLQLAGRWGPSKRNIELVLNTITEAQTRTVYLSIWSKTIGNIVNLLEWLHEFVPRFCSNTDQKSDNKCVIKRGKSEHLLLGQRYASNCKRHSQQCLVYGSL